MSSKKQRVANKKNAEKSTGATSKAGKAKVSTNALRHGVLSTKLVLPNESEEDFLALLDEMITSLRPVGLLEFTLVEKIAVNLWQQRRLLIAENAELAIQMTSESIAESVGQIRWHNAHSTGLSYSDKRAEETEPEELMQLVTKKKMALTDATEKRFSRYQTSLDNGLYKTMRALREQQKWRKDSIESEAVIVDDD